MMVEPIDGLYESLAHSIWMTVHFWLTQQIIRGQENNNLEMGLVTIANLLFPYATEKGKTVFIRMKSELLAAVE